jgi:putative ABC transport system permease protein
MRRLRAWLLRLTSLLHTDRDERNLSAELQSHLQMHIEDNLRFGMSHEEARRQALIKLGGVEQAKEAYRDRRGLPWLEHFFHDLHYGLRMLRKRPGFTLVALLTLALGIGANTALFSLVDAILLNALPYSASHELYVIREDVQVGSQFYGGSVDNAGNFLQWRRDCHSFTGIAALEPENDNLDLGDGAVQVHGTRSSANLFSILDVQPRLGRTFRPEEDEPGRNREVILTDGLWRTHFQSDPNIIGKTIRFNGCAYTVTGVLPSTFYFPRFDQLDGEAIAGWTFPIQYFVPLGLRPGSETKPGLNNMNFTVVARLKPGVSRQQALSDLDAVEADITRHDPHAGGALLRADLLPMKAAVVDRAELSLWILMAGAGVVLFIVCVNLAGLLLARNMGRTHEVAVRVALGATRWNLLRQFLAEGLLLAIAGGTLGLLLAYDGLQALVHSAPVSLPRLESVHIDAGVLVFSLAISLGAGLLFALLPGLRLSRAELGEALKSGARTASGIFGAARLRDLLTGSQVALCTVLLIAALLLAQSLAKVLKANRWLEAQHALSLDLVVPSNEYGPQAAREHLYANLLEKINASPAVRAAGFSSALPLRGELWTDGVDFQESPLPDQKQPSANFRFVSPGYFRAIGLPLVKGSLFADSDEGQNEVIISDEVAKEALPGRDPIGMHLRWQPPDSNKVSLYRVVGVVADARTEADQKAPLIVYVPYWTWCPFQASMVLRAAGDPRAVAAQTRETIRRLDSQIAIPREQTMQDVVNEAVTPRRFVTWLATLFATFATFLAALGLYGAISLSVNQRTQEFGIRIALGATRARMARMVVAKGIKLSLAGVAVGVCCALTLIRLMATMLYGVRSTDPATFAAVGAILTLVALLASYLPARRAIRVDPMVALLHE